MSFFIIMQYAWLRELFHGKTGRSPGTRGRYSFSAFHQKLTPLISGPITPIPWRQVLVPS